MRNQEGAYWADFLARTTQTFPEPSQHVAVAAEKQKSFFKAVDTFHAEVHDEFCKPQAGHQRADYDSTLSTAMNMLNKRHTRSRTVVFGGCMLLACPVGVEWSDASLKRTFEFIAHGVAHA